MLASDEDGGTLQTLKFSLASEIVELLVLTRDEAFLQTLREAVGGTRRLWHVLSADKVSDLLVAGEVGIVVLDAQALHEAASVFVGQIKRQFPDLVVVAAGHRDDETSLAGLISAGMVYRFIHKPMSPARAKLFAEAAIKRYEEQRRLTATIPIARRKASSNRSWLLAGLIGALVLIAAVAWFALRSGGDAASPPSPFEAAKQDSPALARAAAALAANRLTEPPGDNALELYSGLQARNPADVEAGAGLAEVHERLLARAENALLEERLEEAAAAIETARKSGVESGRIAFLSAQLAKLRGQIKLVQDKALSSARPRNEPKPEENPAAPPPARLLEPLPAPLPPPVAQRSADDRPPEPVAELPRPAVQETAHAEAPAGAHVEPPGAAAEVDAAGELLKNVNERLLQDRLIEPANDSAKYFYLTLKQLDPGNAALGPVLQDLGNRLAVKARRALILGQYDAAKSWLEEESAIGFSSAAVNSAQQDLDTALAKQNFMANLVPVNQLTPLKTVQPVYPDKARGHQQEGWVDVEFTVSETGKVQDVAIRAASSPGVFDDAALKAVNQWRYRPMLRDAKPVPVRTQIRLRFTLSSR
ncbi:MAG TPA: TonB family protein [Steroidobacteraceae bacterium]|nr:TonB family protein [Steroidobacteraceae bacterium]